MTTTATTLVPNFFLSEAIGALRKNQGLVRFISKDYSKEVAEKGKTVTIAKRGAMVIQDGVEGTAPVFQDTTDTPINITLDKWKYVAWKSTDLASGLGIQNVLNRIEDAMIGLSDEMESTLLGLYADAGSAVGAYGTDLSDSTVLAARRALNEAGAPETGRILAVSPKDDEALLKTAEYRDADKRGTNEALAEAEIGRVRGFNTYYSSQIHETGAAPLETHNIAFHPMAFAMLSRAMPIPERFTGATGEIMVDPVTGVAMRYLKAFDMTARQHIEYIDVLYGMVVQDDRLLVELQS